MEMVVLMFGRYAIDRDRRCLINGHDVISLGGRAFDVLVALVEAKGAIVTKDALIDRVWEGRFVNDNAIEAQIHALRRSLGSDRNLIKTLWTWNRRADRRRPTSNPICPALLPGMICWRRFARHWASIGS